MVFGEEGENGAPFRLMLLVISAHDKDGTLETFRAQAVVHSEEFEVQSPPVEMTEEGYSHEHPLCESHSEVLDVQTAKGVALQLTLVQSA